MNTPAEPPPEESSDSTSPYAPDAERKMRELVTELENRGAARKSRGSGQDAAKRSEGVYMLIFSLILIGSMAAVQGYFAGLDAIIGARTGVAIKAATWGEDMRELGRGLLLHLRDHWYIDAILVVAVVCVAFGIPSEKRRRRFFALTTSLTVIIFACMMLKDLLEALQIN